MRLPSPKLSAPLLMALCVVPAGAQAEGRAERAAQPRRTTLRGQLEKPLSRRAFLRIDPLRRAGKELGREVVEALHEPAPAAAPVTERAKPAQTVRRAGTASRRRFLTVLAAGLAAMALPKSARADLLELKGTRSFLSSLLPGAQASEAKKRATADKSAPERKAEIRDRGKVVAPVRLGGGAFIISRYKTKERPNHRGIDIAAPPGTPIRAATDGVVLFAARKQGYGRAVVIWRKDGGIKTLYGHMASQKVKAGQEVHAGDEIGTVGNSGKVRGKNGGYHLHFEWHENAPKTADAQDDCEVNPTPHVYPGR